MKIYRVSYHNREDGDRSDYYRNKENALASFQKELNRVKTDDEDFFSQDGPYSFRYWDDYTDCYTYVDFRELDDSIFFCD